MKALVLSLLTCFSISSMAATNADLQAFYESVVGTWTSEFSVINYEIEAGGDIRYWGTYTTVDGSTIYEAELGATWRIQGDELFSLGLDGTRPPTKVEIISSTPTSLESTETFSDGKQLIFKTEVNGNSLITTTTVFDKAEPGKAPVELGSEVEKFKRYLN